MRLFERMLEPAVRLEVVEATDGEGGHYTRFEAVETFEAACVCNNTQEAAIAEKAGAEDTYTVTTTHALNFGDVFVRERDSKAFKVISNGQEAITPACATFAFKQYKARAYELDEVSYAY